MTTTPQTPLGDGQPGAGGFGWLPYVLVAMSMLFFAGNTVMGRATHEEIPPMALVFWRQIGAMVLLAPFVYRELRDKWPLVRQHWRLIALIGVTQAVTGQALIYTGLQTTTAINTGVIGTTQAPLILVVAWLLFGSTVSLRQGVGLALAIVGVLTIVSRGSFDALLGLDFVIGDLLVQLATLSWAVYTTVLRRAPPGLGPYALTLAATVFGAVGMVPLYAGELLLTDARMAVTLPTMAAMAYFIVCSSVLALVFLTIGVARIGPVRASPFFYTVPLLTALLAVPLLRETLTLYHGVGMVLALSGVYLASGRRLASGS